MLAAACLTILAAVVGGVYLIGYWTGRTRTVRESEGYLKAKAEGYRAGIAHDERVRAALRAERNQALIERDRIEDALDDLGAMYDQHVARQFVPAIQEAIADAVVGDDTFVMLHRRERSGT